MISRKFCAYAFCFATLFMAQFAPSYAQSAAQHSVKVSSLSGDWLGELHADAQTLHLRLNIKTDDSGQPDLTLYSLDQGAQPIPCTNVRLKGQDFSFDVPAVTGHWSGKVSDDTKSLVGTWKQTVPRDLTFTRQ